MSSVIKYFFAGTYTDWLKSEKINAITVERFGAPVPIGFEDVIANTLRKSLEMVMNNRFLPPDNGGSQKINDRVVNGVSNNRYSMLGAIQLVSDQYVPKDSDVVGSCWRKVLAQIIYGAAMGLCDPEPVVINRTERGLTDLMLKIVVNNAINLCGKAKLYSLQSFGKFWRVEEPISFGYYIPANGLKHYNDYSCCISYYTDKEMAVTRELLVLGLADFDDERTYVNHLKYVSSDAVVRNIEFI